MCQVNAAFGHNDCLEVLHKIEQKLKHDKTESEKRYQEVHDAMMDLQHQLNPSGHAFIGPLPPGAVPLTRTWITQEPLGFENVRTKHYWLAVLNLHKNMKKHLASMITVVEKTVRVLQDQEVRHPALAISVASHTDHTSQERRSARSDALESAEPNAPRMDISVTAHRLSTVQLDE